jgi:hypothetical protein
MYKKPTSKNETLEADKLVLVKAAKGPTRAGLLLAAVGEIMHVSKNAIAVFAAEIYNNVTEYFSKLVNHDTITPGASSRIVSMLLVLWGLCRTKSCSCGTPRYR